MLPLCHASLLDDHCFIAFLLEPKCVISLRPARYAHHSTNTIMAFLLCTRLSR
uniref:Uncharacterized protein n=1 Tax=uncultured gamma proteobacterium HF0010_05D02 TaxID=710978 RepID=E0XQL8_9GAMM|nr:hypothetical protein [uncultured gamma proteobacterium HF0010_05D02]